MKCPYCGEEMIKGFLMSSRDITFAIDNPNGKLFRSKKREDLELSKALEKCLPCNRHYKKNIKISGKQFVRKQVSISCCG